MREVSQDLVSINAKSGLSVGIIPKIISVHGAAANFAWEEFFSGQIRNPNTRKAYLTAVRQFLSWIEKSEIELPSITPGLIGMYFDQHPGSAPTKKLHMSAIRGLFDTLVLRHVIVLNPALSVRTEKYSAAEGKTPDLTTQQVRKLLASINLASQIDYRDHAIISTLIFTAARVGAIARLQVKDFVDEGHRYTLNFVEKRGKHRSIPVRHELGDSISKYLETVFLGQKREGSLFRSAIGKSGRLSERAISAIDICRMLKRRLDSAGLPTKFSPHSFRSCAATDLLTQGVPLDEVQYLLSHADARVTRLYDRRQKQVTRNIVERISV
ncbi:MAG: tyrosine-type recombinase/integrase [Planctomycetota bacterium]